MAQEYDNNNRGSIWKNEKKETDTHPDFTGSLNVNGVEYWVSAWKRKQGASEKAPALSFSIKPKDASTGTPQRQDTPSNERTDTFSDFDSDIPFANPYKGRASYVV